MKFFEDFLGALRTCALIVIFYIGIWELFNHYLNGDIYLLFKAKYYLPRNNTTLLSCSRALLSLLNVQAIFNRANPDPFIPKTCPLDTVIYRTHTTKVNYLQEKRLLPTYFTILI